MTKYQKRDQAFKEFIDSEVDLVLSNLPAMRLAFNTGWAARKDAQYQAFITGDKDE